MIYFVLGMLLAVDCNVWNNAEEVVPVRSFITYVPAISQYNATAELFYDVGATKFARIVEMDHFIDHQLKKQHPEEKPRPVTWKNGHSLSGSQGNQGTDSHQGWGLGGIKEVVVDNAYLLLFLGVFLVIFYKRMSQSPPTQIRLPSVEEELHESEFNDIECESLNEK